MRYYNNVIDRVKAIEQHITARILERLETKHTVTAAAEFAT